MGLGNAHHIDFAGTKTEITWKPKIQKLEKRIGLLERYIHYLLIDFSYKSVFLQNCFCFGGVRKIKKIYTWSIYVCSVLIQKSRYLWDRRYICSKLGGQKSKKIYMIFDNSEVEIGFVSVFLLFSYYTTSFFYLSICSYSSRIEIKKTKSHIFWFEKDIYEVCPNINGNAISWYDLFFRI